MFLHEFQILLNFLYVCRSVSWFTSLLKLDKYRDISSSGWDFFLNFLEAFLECLYNRSKPSWFSCMSVGLLPYLIIINIRISPVLNEISIWFVLSILGCLYTCFEYFPFPCMSVSLVFDSLPFRNCRTPNQLHSTSGLGRHYNHQLSLSLSLYYYYPTRLPMRV